MKYKIFIAVIVFMDFLGVKAQTPQIALVHPNGTTFICSNFDTAYNAAVNGDFIYLPGGFFTVTNPINKSIHIYGAGYNQDSCVATGITTLNSITIYNGAEGGSIEGIKVNQTYDCSTGCIRFGDASSSGPISGYTISKCNLIGGLTFFSACSNFIIKNNLIGGHSCYFDLISFLGDLTISLINNNIVTGTMNIGPANLIANNIFFYASDLSTYLASYCTYQNNIFQPQHTWYSNNSTFNNNLNASISGNENMYSENLIEIWDSTFVAPGSQYSPYDVHKNYHVRTTSVCHNSGTDGTDRGTYGGAFPWIEGSIPSNPHIYFKQIDQVTGSDGKLHIQVGVRANN